jgi:hypothetical protein
MKNPRKNEPALSDMLLVLRFAEKKRILGLFGTKCRFQQDVGRLALFARWVFEEKFHSDFEVRQPSKKLNEQDFG